MSACREGFSGASLPVVSCVRASVCLITCSVPSGVAVLCDEPAIKLEISVERDSFVPCLVPLSPRVLCGPARVTGARVAVLGKLRRLPAHGVRWRVA